MNITTATYRIDQTLDTQGLTCPEPVMLLHKKVREMKSGEIVEVFATDPSTQRDIPKFCNFLGHELLQRTEGNSKYTYIIQKG